MKREITAVFLIMVMGISDAATFSILPSGHVGIAGAIEKGDYQRFKKFILENPVVFAKSETVSLNSPGGDIDEAISLAEFIETSRFNVSVPSKAKCLSACFIIFASASVRDAKGVVAVHRPYISATSYAGSSLSYVTQSQKQGTARTLNFLRSRSVPEDILRQLTNTPSTSAHVLTDRELVELSMISHEWEEVLIVQCKLSWLLPLGSPEWDRQWSCARNTAIMARIQLLARFVSPEVSREVHRRILLDAGAIEWDDGTMSFENEKEPVPAAPSSDRKTSKFSGLPSGEAPSDLPLEIPAVDLAWKEAADKAKIKGIPVTDPGDSTARFEMLNNYLLPRLAARGDAKAAYQLGLMAIGLGNYETGISNIKIASELGNSQALAHLAMLYELGEGVPVDRARALAYFMLAKKRGIAMAAASAESLRKRMDGDEMRAANQLEAMIESTLPYFKENTP